MPPRVSVIIPTYNRQESVQNTIQSVLEQTFQDFEIIVIDDGSTDNTRNILSTYTNSRIHYFYQENQGLPCAWNMGIKKSTGEYLAFLDSDDVWLKDKLQKQIEFMDEQPELTGCFTGYFLATINQKRKAILPSQSDATLKGILWKNILHLGTTFLCKKEVFEEVGLFDEVLRRGQDSDWLIRYRKKFNVGVIQEPLAIYNQHLSRNAQTMEQSRLYFLKKHKDTLLEQGIFFYKRKSALIYTDLAYHFYRENNLIKAKEYAMKAVIVFPFTWLGLYLILFDVHFNTTLKKKLDEIKYPKVFK